MPGRLTAPSSYHRHVVCLLERCAHIGQVKQLQAHVITSGGGQSQFLSFKLLRFCSLVLSDLPTPASSSAPCPPQRLPLLRHALLPPLPSGRRRGRGRSRTLQPTAPPRPTPPQRVRLPPRPTRLRRSPRSQHAQIHPFPPSQDRLRCLRRCADVPSRLLRETRRLSDRASPVRQTA
uniref:Uncharacterized protein n=1 Tax=Ananas comosus var. bracteatus TaxID=296719 RepID=A0A6V7NWX5_ANACO|nr:unnamed protein product [Ananas comosus var. bracteatus]